MGCHDVLKLGLVEAKRGSAVAVRLLAGSDCPARLVVPCPGLRVRLCNPRLAECSPEAGSRGDMLPRPRVQLRGRNFLGLQAGSITSNEEKG